MQVKNNTSIDMGKTKKWSWIAFKAFITIVSFYFIHDQFEDRTVTQSLDFPDHFISIMIFQFFLMIVNWILEIHRWKISVDSSEKISFRQASIDVLGGLTMNWIVPFTVGDFITRIATKRDKYKATSAIFLNRVIMLFLTLLVGLHGLISLLHVNGLYLMVGASILAAVLFVADRVTHGRFSRYFTELNRKTLWKIILISICRYGIFFLQFIILIAIFNPELATVTISAGIGWVFLVRTSIPSLFGGVGLREASALFFFQNLVTDTVTVVFPVFVLWVLNTAIPSLLGSLLLWKFKTHNSEDSHNIAR